MWNPARLAVLLLNSTDLPTCPEHTVAQLWRALTHGPDAAADVVALRQLFHPEARIIGSRYDEAGAAVLRIRTLEEFLAVLAPSEPKGFHECEVEREVREHDRFAVVYSVVESRSDPQQPAPDVTGVNSLQLHRGPDGWRIVSLHYQLPPPGTSFPVAPGRSGQCLDQ